MHGTNTHMLKQEGCRWSALGAYKSKNNIIQSSSSRGRERGKENEGTSFWAAVFNSPVAHQRGGGGAAVAATTADRRGKWTSTAAAEAVSAVHRWRATTGRSPSAAHATKGRVNATTATASAVSTAAIAVAAIASSLHEAAVGEGRRGGKREAWLVNIRRRW